MIASAALIELAALICYWELAPLPLASALMLAAIVLALMGEKPVCAAQGNVL